MVSFDYRNVPSICHRESSRNRNSWRNPAVILGNCLHGRPVTSRLLSSLQNPEFLSVSAMGCLKPGKNTTQFPEDVHRKFASGVELMHLRMRMLHGPLFLFFFRTEMSNKMSPIATCCISTNHLTATLLHRCRGEGPVLYVMIITVVRNKATEGSRVSKEGEWSRGGTGGSPRLVLVWSLHCRWAGQRGDQKAGQSRLKVGQKRLSKSQSEWSDKTGLWQSGNGLSAVSKR